jgi:hypothetical protein
MKDREGGEAIERERIDEGLACFFIVPIARRFSRLLAIVDAIESAPHLGGDVGVDDAEQSDERRPDEGDGVLGGNGVVERDRVEDAFSADEPRGARGFDDRLEDAIWSVGVARSLAHVDKDGVDETRMIEVEQAGGVFPARVEHDGINGFTIVHAGVALKDHDDGDDAQRDGAAPGAREEIGERFVGKKLVGARGEKRKKSSSPASATRRARGSNGRDPRAWVLGRRS